jgi:hypothetical protein
VEESVNHATLLTDCCFPALPQIAVKTNRNVLSSRTASFPPAWRTKPACATGVMAHAGTSGVYANRPRHGVDLRRFLIRFTVTKDRNIQGIDSGGKMGGSHMIATGGIVNAAIPSEDRAFLAPGRRSSVHRLNTATPASLRRSQFTLEDMRHTGHFAPTKPDVVPSSRLFTSFLRNRRNRSPSIMRDSCERRRCPARCSFFQCHPITARFHWLKKLSRRPHGRLCE